tara:strand:+ start:81 stop:677 length:597 start_codon:yes stop_codon:yes gene_type:complete
LKYIIYLHGFNSSSQSEKARITQKYFNDRYGSELSVIVPDLPPAPLDAMSSVHDLIKIHGRDNLIGFIGSSLGGFYSLYLQDFYATSSYFPKAALINPAVHPYNLLQDYIGENQNMYTGETYMIHADHMADLKSLDVQPISKPQCTYLLTQTGDEVLNYQEAVHRLSTAKMWIQFSGNHAFEGYLSTLPSIENFFVSG